MTEFLPVSSSGHLQLAQYWLGITQFEYAIPFALACHFGTLLAALIVLFEPMLTLFRKKTGLTQLFLATLPLFPLVFLMKPIKAAFSDIQMLGYCFLATSGILFLGIHFGKIVSEKDRGRRRWTDALLIGCWQSLAILPGISRSGATISGARLLGWSPYEAVIFSFLLAIPATLGGIALETYHLIKEPELLHAIPLLSFAVGMCSAFLCGLYTFRLLLRSLYNKFSYFAWYCLILGLAATALFHL